MISHWTSTEGKAAFKKMGAPEWDRPEDTPPHPNIKGHLVAWDRDQLFVCQLDDGGVRFVGPKVALSRIRDHAREWLREHRIRVVQEEGAAGCWVWLARWDKPDGDWAFLGYEGTWTRSDERHWDDEDETLVASIIAAETNHAPH